MISDQVLLIVRVTLTASYSVAVKCTRLEQEVAGFRAGSLVIGSAGPSTN